MLFRATLPYLRSHSGFRASPLTFISRAALWRLRCSLNLPATVEMKPYSAKMFLPANRSGEGTTMLYAARGNFEPELPLLRRFVRPDQIAIDVGAYIGAYTTVLASICRKVYSFEPSNKSFKSLKRNIYLNHFSNVEAFQQAVADTNGPMKLYHDPLGSGSNSLGNVSEHSEEVQAVTLDAVVREKNSVGLLKIDAQGAEPKVIAGAIELIRASHPTIIFEVDEHSATEGRFSAWNRLRELGYNFSVITKTGELQQISEPPYEKNVIARYKI